MKRLIALLSATPGVALAALVWSKFAGEYYVWPYLLGCVFLSLSGAVAAIMVIPRRYPSLSPVNHLSASIVGGLLGGLAGFFLSNLTPLCVGQNNGDGLNDLGSCIVIPILALIFFSPAWIGVTLSCLAVGSVAVMFFGRTKASS